VRALEGTATFYLNQIGESNYEQSMISGIPMSEQDSSWSVQLNANTNKKSQSVSVYRKDTRTQPIFCYNCWYYLTVKVEQKQQASYRVFF